MNLYSISTGFTGVTKKNDGVGCICHGNFEANTNVQVYINGPDSVISGQSAVYTITIKGGPQISGGFNTASHTGTIDTVISDQGVKLQDNELTHTMPRPFQGDSVYWTFKYTAPHSLLTDTLYAVGNSTNNNGMADTADEWNFSVNKTVRVYTPIGIKPVSNKIPDNFSISQNYPNPFNPITKIRFSINSTGEIKLSVYNATGKLAATLVNEKLSSGEYEIEFNGNEMSSGIYFYSLFINDKLLDTKKMMLIK